jgi:Family of unknown function (DUF6152)
MRTKLLAAMLGIGLFAAAKPVVAHHAFAAEYDVKQPVKLKGTITKMEWINPHSWIHLDVKRPDGTVDSWMVESGPPSGLVRRGFTKNSVPPGIEVTIDGYRAKDGSLQANGQYITLPDGRALFAGTPGTGAPDAPSQK